MPSIKLDKIIRHLLVFGMMALFVSAAGAQQPTVESIKARVAELITQTQEQAESYNRYDLFFPPNTEIIEVRKPEGQVVLTFNRYLGYRTWHPESAEDFLAMLRTELGDMVSPDEGIQVMIRYGNRDYTDYDLDVHILQPEKILERQDERAVPPPPLKNPVVDRVDYAGPAPTDGLMNKQIAVGPSHGYTWHEENRWQYQRARVYTIVEDLFPLSYVNPFLIPMLENAGATVWPVRERDYQFNEVIVDNDGTTRYSELVKTGTWEDTSLQGWSGGRPAALDQQTEPFTLGTTMRASVPPADSPTSSTAVYTPYIPAPGKYAVYLSWPMSDENSSSVPVHIKHLGGTTTVRVNQQVAGNTWVFVGFYEFDQGTDAEAGSVTFTTSGAALNESGNTYVAADAVRFGGGMGNIAPMDSVSYKPRYAEASMYWLQYAGAPREMVYLRKFGASHFGEDYWSDIAARVEWVNYLHGAPNGPNPVGDTNYRDERGLRVPMDLSLSFHTDAGFDEEGLIGTLMIYTLEDDIGNTEFPDGRSRWLNRDLSVLLQDEVIRTARTKYSSTFAKRHVWERNLGEVRRPNVPSALIELVSHHNFNDMKYGIDPRFQKDMSRAMYKAIARFLAYSEGREPVIQPLEPTHLAARSLGGGRAEISWRGRLDPLEPSAQPEGYIVYTSDDGRAFNNGRYTESISMIIDGLEPEVGYAFRVTAVNSGGESLPSRTVGMRWVEGQSPILIVDGFDRISGPEVVHRDRTHGFDRAKDPGVYYQYNYGLVGDQYDFDPKHSWQNDLESPGMGGSQNLMEDFLEKGNTFDHITVHGAALAEKGLAYDSALSEAYSSGLVVGTYTVIDWIAGRQRTVMPYTGWDGPGTADRMRPEFAVLTSDGMARLRDHVNSGGKLIISGAHLVGDLRNGHLASENSNDFATTTLGAEVSIPDATSTNTVEPLDGETPFADVEPFWFGRDLMPPHNLKATVYTVPRAEGFVSLAPGFSPIMSYGDSEVDAGIASGNVVLLGFPIETVLPPERRSEILGASFEHLTGVTLETEEDEE